MFLFGNLIIIYFVLLKHGAHIYNQLTRRRHPTASFETVEGLRVFVAFAKMSDGPVLFIFTEIYFGYLSNSDLSILSGAGQSHVSDYQKYLDMLHTELPMNE